MRISALALCRKLLLLFIFSGSLFCQNTDSLVTQLREKFSSFDYNNAIKISDIILQKKEALPKQLLLEIYRIRGVSHYSTGDEKSSEESFISILMLDSSYVLEPDINSPKIIAFFNEIKQSHPGNKAGEEAFIPAEQYDQKVKSINYELKNTIMRSLILPGWGHLYSNQTTKGVVLTSISAISLVSSIYFISDCSEKEKNYLSESDRALIPSKYDKYNSSYWLRNISILTFALTWVYSQVDLLFFSSPAEDKMTITGIIPSDNSYYIKFQLRL